MNESGGQLTGAGTVTVDGLLTWTGGTMSGSGTTLAKGGLQLGANDGNPHFEALDARTFQNAGFATAFSTDTFSQNASSIFQNLAHGTLEVQNGVTWSGGGTLDNQYQGTVTVDAGAGTASFNGFTTDEGDLEVKSGTVFLGAGGNVTGNVVVDAAATLEFGGTQYVFNPVAGLTGQGTVTFGAPFAQPATTFDAGSSYSFSGATNILDGATVVFDATGSTSTLNQSGGSLGGSATLTVGGMTTWTGGTMSGSGITNSLGGLSLGASGDPSDSETLAGRTLLSAGTGVWYGPDTLTQQENSTFLNYSGATLTIDAGGTWGSGDEIDPSGTFQNNGTLIVADGSASTLVQPFFGNTSTVEIASGTLRLGGGGSCTSSPAPVKAGFQVDSGATLLFGNNENYQAYTFDSGSYVSGPARSRSARASRPTLHRAASTTRAARP